MSDADSDNDENNTTPFQHQRAFGAGLSRKRVAFVRESAPSTSTTSAAAPPPKRPVGDVYLSIVLPATSTPAPTSPAIPTTTSLAATPLLNRPTTDIPHDTAPPLQSPTPTCPICNLPIPAPAAISQISQTSQPNPHESTLAHQLSLPHSHPPSHLDRHRKGLAYLCSHGWNPDARTGLGAAGQGRLYPVRADERGDRRGVGAEVQVKGKGDGRGLRRLGAKECRKGKEEEKRREGFLRALVYGDEEINRLLGVRL